MDKRVEAAMGPLSVEWGERAAQRAVSALTAMTQTGRPEEVTQWRVQQFCWEMLPNATSLARRDRLLAAMALAALLARFDLHRYAAIAAGPRTRSLIESSAPGPFDRSDWRGASPRESAITPPDTDQLTWLEESGPAEQDAYERVANALELACAAGELVAGRTDSAAVRHRLTDAVLETPLPELGGLAPLHAVLTERFHEWAGSGSPRGDLLGPLEPELTSTSSRLPAAHGDRLVPQQISWLVDQCLGGVRLTAAGHLPGRVVRAYLDEFGADQLRAGRSPRESNVPSLRFYLGVAERARLLVRRGGSLVTSGRAMTAAWGLATRRRVPSIADLLARAWVGGAGDLACEVAELVCAALLTGPVDPDHLARWVEATSGHRRWGEARGTPLAAGAIASLTSGWLAATAGLGLIRPASSGGHLELTPAGAPFLLEALRQRLAHGHPGFSMQVELSWPDVG